MVMKEGIGRVGVGTVGSDSMVLRRDRGRWWSPVERMKGSLDSSPPAPDELRFRPGTAGGRPEGGRGVSGLVAGDGDVGWSMAG